MNLITKASIIKEVSKRWDETYNTPTWLKDERKVNIGNKLRSGECNTEDSINELIGNKTWTENLCFVCGKDNELIVEMSENVGFDTESLCVCKECLTKALNLINETI